ncbi:unnamed protein product [Bursaphelenchus xylophilus]|uniref:Flavin-containing monooxygenase n=1 Tax=Bursaphelenchus xylophilus TaxID=6326 RepID=A0A1I7RJ71_BURXY|nr:unnamed protein product [Bursaphelenchus xylophilus]CAG9119421.1 unnamed protein product [Bursaphelenchus xylophilus]
MMKKRVCVVGAGPSGLPSARWALEYGFTPVIFEATDSLGGLWNYKEDETEWSTVNSFTVNNTSKELTSYSDFPPKESSAPYMPWRDLLSYFKDYAHHHGIDKYILYKHRVINIQRAANYKETGNWMVQYQDGSGAIKSQMFEYVIIATGHHGMPNLPDEYPGQSSFTGKIIHSKAYKNNKDLDGKTVVAVGLGNSAIDVATDSSRVAKQVYLSTRRGGYVWSKVGPFGRPMDTYLNRRFVATVKKIAPALYSFVAEQFINAVFEHKAYGLAPKHRVIQQQGAFSDELFGRLIGGSVKVTGEIREFTENGIIFADGKVVEDVDLVVFGTGFKFNFNILENGGLIPVDKNIIQKDRKLWKRIFPINLAPKSTLGMIGFFQPVGSLMPISEMQARLFFEVATGSIKLPPAEVMRAEMDESDKKMANRFYSSTRHTLQVDFTGYMTELADLIGCTPNFKQLIFSDPKLAFHAFFGPDVAYCYRISGPKSWSGAREAVLGCQKRLMAGVKHRQGEVGNTNFYLAVLVIVLVALIASYGVFGGCIH